MNRVELQLVPVLLLALSLGCATAPPLPCSADPATARKEVESAYVENGAGFKARDPDRVMRLRHPDFHTVTPDGRVNTRSDMDTRTRMLIERVVEFQMISEVIESFSLHGDTAIAVVRQHTIRTQRMQDGEPHKLESTVTQREWWRCTADGWRMWRVDEIGDGTVLIDGRPRE
jgi:ketosteroid isomerase-like protein